MDVQQRSSLISVEGITVLANGFQHPCFITSLLKLSLAFFRKGPFLDPVEVGAIADRLRFDSAARWMP